MVFLRKRIQGRNKIQDAWEPTMFIITELPTEHWGPYTVSKADGTSKPKRVSRAELQPCPLNISFGEPACCWNSTSPPSEVHEDTSSTDSDVEFLLQQPCSPTVPSTQQPSYPIHQQPSSPVHQQPITIVQQQPSTAATVVPPRRSRRTTAGKHSNPLNRPRSVLDQEVYATVRDSSIFMLVLVLFLFSFVFV